MRDIDAYFDDILPMILLKKRGTGDVRSPLNLGGRPYTYARKECKAG